MMVKSGFKSKVTDGFTFWGFYASSGAIAVRAVCFGIILQELKRHRKLKRVIRHKKLNEQQNMRINMLAGIRKDHQPIVNRSTF